MGTERKRSTRQASGRVNERPRLLHQIGEPIKGHLARAAARLGGTSISNASTPIATAPWHTAVTGFARLAPRVRSIMMGQWDACVMLRPADRSSVERV